MKIGDKVKKRICFNASKDGAGSVHEEAVLREGTVVYVHPQGRFYVAEFQFRSGCVKESYYIN